MSEHGTVGQPGPKLVFLHVPRTGGTTLTHHLEQGFAPAEICPLRWNELHEHAPAALDRYRLFAGHFFHGTLDRIPGTRQVATVLRDPRERLLSLYRFWARHNPVHIVNHRLTGPALAAASPDLGAFLASS